MTPARILPPLYPIVDVSACADRGLDAAAVADAYLRGGARLLQVRDKNSGSAALLALAERLVAAARASGARIIVNDRADIARLAGAAGVHLGQEDLPPDAVRTIVGPSATVGLSTHTREQVDAALDTSATYVAVGPIYGTATKDTGYDARGLDLIRYAARRGKPIVAIGGITLDRASEAIAAGASSLAVISDLLAGDPEARTREFLNRIGP